MPFNFLQMVEIQKETDDTKLSHFLFIAVSGKLCCLMSENLPNGARSYVKVGRLLKQDKIYEPCRG